MINIIQLLAQVDIDPDDLNIPRPAVPDDNTITTIVNVVFGIAGAVAMIVIVIAGIGFILSRGDPQKSANARNTIIYAGVGLAIAVLAFSIVSFVVGSL